MTKIVRVGIGVLIFNSLGEILLGERIGAHQEAHTYAPPGGHLEFGESFAHAACREVLEETGLVICEPEFLCVTNDIFAAEEKHYVSIFMKAMMPTGKIAKVMEPDKVKTWQWFSLCHLPDNLFLPMKNIDLALLKI